MNNIVKAAVVAALVVETGGSLFGARARSERRRPVGFHDRADAACAVPRDNRRTNPRRTRLCLRRSEGPEAVREPRHLRASAAFLNEDLAIGTYRHAVAITILEMTKVAWGSVRRTQCSRF